MDSLINDYAAGIFRSPEPPCLSLYQPTHRTHPDNQQYPIRFGNLVKKTLGDSLRQKYSAHDVRPLLEPLQTLANNLDFWNQALGGLAGTKPRRRGISSRPPAPDHAQVKRLALSRDVEHFANNILDVGSVCWCGAL